MVAAWVIPLAVCVPLVAIFIVAIYFCCFYEPKSVEWNEDGAEKHQNEPYDDAADEFADEDDAEVGRVVVHKKSMFSKKKQDQARIDSAPKQGSKPQQKPTSPPSSTTRMSPGDKDKWFGGFGAATGSPRGSPRGSPQIMVESMKASLQNLDSARVPYTARKLRETHAEKRVRTEERRKEWSKSQTIERGLEEDEASGDHMSREPSEDCEEMEQPTARPGGRFGLLY